MVLNQTNDVSTGPLLLHDRPIPVPKAGQVLVKIHVCGVCRTDLHVVEGELPDMTLPLIPGHQAVGTVTHIGSDVSEVKEGDRIGIAWLQGTCGQCEFCTSGRENLCLQAMFTGYQVDGGYAEYVLADPGYVGHLPSNVNFSAMAPVLCAGVTVYKGLKVLDCRPGNWVAISGVGGLGHMAVQYAKAMGFHVAAVDIDDEKLELAKKLGAELVVNAKKADPAKELQRALRGAHGVLVTAVSRTAFDQALGMLHKRGTMALVGLPPGEFGLPIFDVVLNAKTIRGSIVGTRMDLQEAIAFAAEGKVHTVYTEDKLENINGIFDRMRNGAIEGRVVMKLD